VSQYPTPSTPPNAPGPGFYYGADPWAHLTRPARQAGVMMMVLGGVGLVCAGCMGLLGGMVPLDQMPPEQVAVFQQLEAQTGLSATTFIRIMAGVMALPGLLLILLGAFVRAGSVVAQWISVILAGLILLVLGLNLLSGIVQMIADPAAALAHGVGIFMVLVLMGLFILLMVWLIRAISASGQLKLARLQYQMQYWQYMQRQQAYAQGGPNQQPQPASVPQVAAPPPSAPNDPTPERRITERPASGPAEHGSTDLDERTRDQRP
jgi:hypothetical protein